MVTSRKNGIRSTTNGSNGTINGSSRASRGTTGRGSRGAITWQFREVTRPAGRCNVSHRRL
eukprot:2420280-Rhodomonas_salina.2